MKKIKVKPIFGAHQIYQEIVNFPPKGVEYLGVGKNIKKGKYYQSKKLKEWLGYLIQKMKTPRMVFVKPGNYDIIHSSRGIIPLNNKPWVIDMEHVHSFFGLNPKLIKNKFWKRFIEQRLSSKNCKAILCHCEATKKAFFRYLDCNSFRDKIKVLYPASHEINLEKKKHKKIRILVVISLFYHKGGPQILEAFSKLEKKYKNIELWIKADAPEEFKKKYASKNIKWFPYFENILPRKELLKKFHSQCDIFVYPSFCDSFGYSLIDALLTGLPVVTTNLFAFPEIIKNNKNGFIINIPGYRLENGFLQVHPHKKIIPSENKKIVNGLIDKIGRLIKNKKLRDKMRNENLFLIKEGRFSIKERNKLLERVYTEF